MEQTAGESDKMRICHMIKTDQWRSAALRILSSAVDYTHTHQPSFLS